MNERRTRDDQRDRVRREALGRALQAARARRGMKRRELAERSGLSYPYVSEIENGKKEPSSRSLHRLAEALDMSSHELTLVREQLEPEVASDHGALEEGPPRGNLPDRAWFHDPVPRDEALMARAASPPPAPSAARSAPAPRTRRGLARRGELLSELEMLARRLDEPDLERVLDLARRMAD